jgi:probable addiction module antidote protein
MPTATRPFDAAEFLTDPESIAEFLTAAFESRDPAHIANALGVAARARGMTAVARDAGLSRESLYRALSPAGHPELETVVRVLGAMGLRLSVAV